MTSDHESLSGVVHPTPLRSESEHNCAIDGHSLQTVVTFSGAVVRMFCDECGAQWKVEPV